MASIAIRIKSAFVPSTRRSPPQSSTPAHPVPATNAIQSDSQSSSPLTDDPTSTLCSASPTLNVHFPPGQVGSQTGSRSAPRCPPASRRRALNSTSNYNTSPRSRAYSMPSSRRQGSPSAYSSIRIPTIPGVSILRFIFNLFWF
jgi:hypothetical protein